MKKRSDKSAVARPAASAVATKAVQNKPGLPAPPRKLVFSLCLVLCLVTIAVYGQLYRAGFIAYDDDSYVTDNPTVKDGLTSSGIAWAFTTFHCSNWHPLTWLSHMLDWSLFAQNAGAHHLVNLAFHLASVLLLFVAFVSMTGRPWRSAIVAGIFAIHPLHVESVAWVAERKDVLSTFLGLAALVFYIRYVKSPSVLRYVPIIFAFVLGLMAKPMLVTLPFVFVLLDIWPLQRLTWPPDLPKLVRLLKEKLPLFALVVAAGVITFVAQQQGGAVSDLQTTSFPARFVNAIVSYAAYLGKAVWPVKLAVFYPSQTHSGAVVAIALAVLTAVTLGALALARKRPYVLIGWLWYLGMLVPVIGLVQVGSQSMADRYTYLPLVGASFAIVWLVADIIEHERALRIVSASLAFAVLAAFAMLAWRQAAYWQSSKPLFEHTLAVTDRNFVILNNLGVVFDREGNRDRARECYEKALSFLPDYADAHKNLGIILEHEHRFAEAMEHYRAAIKAKPDYAQAHNNLGVLLTFEGKSDEAIEHYRAALAARPDYAHAHANLGHELMMKGNTDEAYEHLITAVRLRPDLPAAHADLGLLLEKRCDLEGAATHLQQALQLSGPQGELDSKLASILLKLNRFDEAISLCREALQLQPGLPEAEATLQSALAAQARANQLTGGAR